MANFEGLALPAYGAFYHYNEAQTAVWTVADDGEFLLAVASTKPGTTVGMEVELALSSTTPTKAYNLLLSRTSTKLATTDALLAVEVDAAAYAGSIFTLDMGAASVVTNFLAVTSTTSPTYFLSVASSGGGLQAAGFVSERRTVAQSTISPYGALHCLVGTASFYIPMFHDTNTASV